MRGWGKGFYSSWLSLPFPWCFLAPSCSAMLPSLLCLSPVATAHACFPCPPLPGRTPWVGPWVTGGYLPYYIPGTVYNSHFLSIPPLSTGGSALVKFPLICKQALICTPLSRPGGILITQSTPPEFSPHSLRTPSLLQWPLYKKAGALYCITILITYSNNEL